MIFNENFDIADKYRLSDGEKVSTVEMMPARFTSLASLDYGPALDTGVKSKINEYFNYKPVDTTDPMYSFDNDFYVYHLDGAIQEFFCKKFFRYTSVAQNGYSWKRFVEGVGLPKINNIKSKLDKFTSVTDATCTWFNGVTLSPTGDLVSLRVYDSSYDLDELASNEFLSRVNEFPTIREDMCKGTIDVYPDSDLITYRLNFVYPKFFDNNYKSKGVVRESEDTKELATQYLKTLSKDDGLKILTTDQVDFITSKLVGESYFNLEYDVNPNGTVSEVFAYIQTTHEFEDLTTH